MRENMRQNSVNCFFQGFHKDQSDVNGTPRLREGSPGLLFPPGSLSLPWMRLAAPFEIKADPTSSQNIKATLITSCFFSFFFFALADTNADEQNMKPTTVW